MKGNLEHYKVFYEVARAGSITAAAERLCISQPAVSQTIKQLEAELGSPLLVRAQKGVRMTTEGEVLYEYLERGFVQIEAGEEAFRSMIDLEEGEIRIGASDMTLRFYLLPYLERFHELYQGVKVKVTNVPTPETLRYIKEGAIDFGVVSSPSVLPKDAVELRPVRKVRDCFVAGNRFAHLKDRKLQLAELSKLPIICLEQHTSTRNSADRFLKENGVVLQPEFELATSDMIVQFVRRNLGIGMVVYDFAEEAIKQGELFCLQFEQPFPEREFCIATREKQVMSKAARALLAMMQSNAEEETQ